MNDHPFNDVITLLLAALKSATGRGIWVAYLQLVQITAKTETANGVSF
jgi:hypothetical protein